MDGVEPLGLLGIVAQLGAQILDVTVNRALVTLEVVAEDLLHQLHTVVHATRMTGERGEELELGGGEVDLFALDQDLVAGDIDHQVTEVEHLDLRLIGLMGATEQRAHASNELTRGERLDEVVVGTELEADDAILDLALCGEHDDRHIGGIANGAANALAGKLGEHEVENDQVELMLLELLDSGLAVANAHDPIALALEVSGHRVANGLLVFNQQNLTCI